MRTDLRPCRGLHDEFRATQDAQRELAAFDPAAMRRRPAGKHVKRAKRRISKMARRANR